MSLINTAADFAHAVYWAHMYSYPAAEPHIVLFLCYTNKKICVFYVSLLTFFIGRFRTYTYGH